MWHRVACAVVGLILAVCVQSAAPEVRCDFFRTPGGFLRATGGAAGNVRCGQWPSLQAAKQECWTNRECDGLSWGRWGRGTGGCLKKNRNGGFKRSRRFVGYHKTTMGCCSGDKFTPGQCKPREEKLVSLRKPAKQSSTAYGAEAGRAVDGNVNTNFGGRSCTHTKSEKSPWWQVDLGKPFEITRIVLVNRGDCCWGRLSGFKIAVGNNPSVTANPTCVENGKQGRGETREWDCPLTGRYVTVSLKGTGYLTLCEVQVFASVTDEVPGIVPPIITPPPVTPPVPVPSPEIPGGSGEIPIWGPGTSPGGSGVSPGGGASPVPGVGPGGPPSSPGGETPVPGVGPEGGASPLPGVGPEGGASPVPGVGPGGPPSSPGGEIPVWPGVGSPVPGVAPEGGASPVPGVGPEGGASPLPGVGPEGGASPVPGVGPEGGASPVPGVGPGGGASPVPGVGPGGPPSSPGGEIPVWPGVGSPVPGVAPEGGASPVPGVGPEGEASPLPGVGPEGGASPVPGVGPEGGASPVPGVGPGGPPSSPGGEIPVWPGVGSPVPGVVPEGGASPVPGVGPEGGASPLPGVGPEGGASPVPGVGPEGGASPLPGVGPEGGASPVPGVGPGGSPSSPGGEIPVWPGSSPIPGVIPEGGSSPAPGGPSTGVVYPPPGPVNMTTPGAGSGPSFPEPVPGMSPVPGGEGSSSPSPGVVPPVIEPPVIHPPIIEPPVVQPPVIEPPVVQPPVIKPPVVQPPVIEPPVVQPPVIKPPVVQPPVIEPPVVQPPVIEPPVVQPPVIEPPVVQPPVIKPPVIEPPVIKPTPLPGFTREDVISLGKNARQSSTGFGGVAQRGNDGDMNSNWPMNTCTHTNLQKNPWWELDLGKTYQVTRVKVFNRGDCCWDRLKHMKISVGDKQPFGLNPACVSDASQGRGEGKSWKCALKGRYVTVSLEATNYLTLCEVQVFGLVHTPPPADVLVSPGKKVIQPTTAFGGIAERAIDGDINSQWPGNSCTHTNLMNNPWWQLDLGKTFKVTRVKITNRGDCCWGRLSKMTIRVGDKQPYTSNPFCIQNAALGRGVTQEYKCALAGRYVSISLAKKDYLTLCEVQVFALRGSTGPAPPVVHPPPPPPVIGGYREDCVSTGKNVRQSSVAFGGVPQRGNDGDRNSNWNMNSCTHTNYMKNPWWEVDLGRTYHVTRVEVTNRGDCCWDRLKFMRISVGDKQPYTLNPACVTGGSQGRGEGKVWKCALTGRFVTVSLQATNYLTLCEVRVFAKVNTPPPADEIVSQGKKVTQPSTAFGGVPERAVDGNINSQWPGNSCTHTNLMNNPWWQVDLGKTYQLTKVKVTNRGDCCWGRLSKMTIRAGDKQPYTSNPTCATDATLARGVTREFKCELKGRYVSISLAKRDYLTLCEVQVYALRGNAPPPVIKPPPPVAPGNHEGIISHGKNVRQSSVAFGGVPQRAIDGDRNSNWPMKSCTHTNNEKNPWWEVDLGSTFYVTKVEVTNRGDCCWDRLKNMKISVGNSQPFTANPACVTGVTQGRGESKAWACNKPGRYVTVSLVGTNYLTLCEVRVYGKVNTPPPIDEVVSVGKKVSQISTAFGGLPQRAVDGNINSQWPMNSCTHTNLVNNPWWQVDLGKTFQVTRVKITNRGDCCWGRMSMLNIFVGDKQPFGGNPTCVTNAALDRGVTREFKCPLKGRYVAVSLGKRDYLTLCEVQVYALKTSPTTHPPVVKPQPKPEPKPVPGNREDIISKGKNTQQSSTAFGGVSQRGNDDNRNSNWPMNSCTHTNLQKNPWWQVDLGAVYQVTKVVITNRGDCCWDRMKSMRISVGYKQQHTMNPSCVVGASQGRGMSKSYTCKMVGRYVTVSLDATNYLTLCEVDVYGMVNTPPPKDELVSAGKNVKQSTTAFGGVAQRAIDSNINSQWPGNSCTHTNLMQDPWWQVDLGKTYTITKVKITNRGDCCWGRMSKMKISVGDNQPFSKNPSCIVNANQDRGTTETYKCPLKGRYVTVSLEKRDYLTLCEVQVFALKGSGVTPPVVPPGGPLVEQLLSEKKQCHQSSTGWGGTCDRAVDGSTNTVYGAGSCSHTESSNRPWWEVDLGRTYQITKVAVTNRGDCCWDRLQKMRISVGDKQPSISNPACITGASQGKAETRTYKCPLKGRYVTISLDAVNYLTLCEVKVYGLAPKPPTIPPPIKPPPGRLECVSKGKHTRQSSTAFGGLPGRAVDGNTNSMWGGGSCSHTNLNAKAWWEVDLGKTFQVAKVVITNRGDCCWDRLTNFRISVGDQQPYTRNPACVVGGSQGKGETKAWKCALKGRYVTINLQGTNYLTLCEVQVFAYVNGPAPPPKDFLVSLRKPTKQSSVAFGGIPQRAVDGNKNSVYGAGSCTHTNLMPKPVWWQVDLGQSFQLTRVLITNRGDCCWDRLRDFKISVGESSAYGSSPSCVQHGRQGRGETKEWPCKLKGRFVTISIPRPEYLTLCEVQVFATSKGGAPPPPMREQLVSFKKPTVQSSTGWGGLPARAVDGNKNSVYGAGSCTHTLFTAQPWWQVDLLKSVQVTRVVITNRGDCCWDRLNWFRVSVGDNRNWRVNKMCVQKGIQGRGETKSWNCPLKGRFVAVSLPGTQYLTLCEVQVFAKVAVANEGLEPEPRELGSPDEMDSDSITTEDESKDSMSADELDSDFVTTEEESNASGSADELDFDSDTTEGEVGVSNDNDGFVFMET